MTVNTTFDEALGKFVLLMADALKKTAVDELLFLRDPSGKLTCIVSDDDLSENQRRQLSEAAEKMLWPYVECDGFAVATAEELLDDGLNDAGIGVQTVVSREGRQFPVRLLDRRVMGGAWLQRNQGISESKRLVFASLKGGVGRSTALCVLAADLASEGYRVLAIDMDVEAPGIGSMLLDDASVPRYGLLDYLVESGLQQLDDAYLESLIAPSWLGAGRGIVSVIPAIGRASFENPQNILSKIARAYLNGRGEESVGITKKMSALLDWIDRRNEFDIVLIDARAGLHETTGSALLGLGGRIILFGTDQRQTISGFEILFSNLAMVDTQGWQDRLVVCHAKASANSKVHKFFAARVQEAFSTAITGNKDSFSPVLQDLSSLDGVFRVEWEEDFQKVEERTEGLISDRNRRVEVAAILESEGYRDFDPLAEPDSLTGRVYESVYGGFLEKAKVLLGVLPESQDDRV